MSKKVKITSCTNNATRIKIPELRVNRLFEKEGQSFLFDAEVIEEMFYYPAIEKAFKEGLFSIDDKELRIKLELEEEDGTVSQEVTAPISNSTILAYLNAKSVSEFKEYFDNLPMSQKIRFADMAIEKKIVNYEKCQIIKDATGKDIMQIIQLNEEE